ncbi:MAG: glycosyltransferase [Burkholderiaceae bacterium]
MAPASGAGHGAHVCAQGHESRCSAWMRPASGPRTHARPAWRCCLWRQPSVDLSCAARIAEYCRREQVDLLHAHQATPWFYCALARTARAAPAHLLFHEHGRFYPETDSPARVWLNRLLVVPNTHRVTTVSDVRQRLARYEGVPARRTEVVLNGTIAEPPVASRAAPPGAHRWASGPSTGWSAQSAARSDPEPADVDPRLPGARWRGCRRCAVSSATARSAMPWPRWSGARELTHHIRLTGHRDDARLMTGIFDVFALASRGEGVSMAILDAMAAAVPVVATAVGGTPGSCVARASWLVPDNDGEAFAEALLDAARDSDAARAVGPGRPGALSGGVHLRADDRPLLAHLCRHAPSRAFPLDPLRPHARNRR